MRVFPLFFPPQIVTFYIQCSTPLPLSQQQYILDIFHARARVYLILFSGCIVFFCKDIPLYFIQSHIQDILFVSKLLLV